VKKNRKPVRNNHWEARPGTLNKAFELRLDQTPLNINPAAKRFIRFTTKSHSTRSQTLISYPAFFEHGICRQLICHAPFFVFVMKVNYDE
jgi:hypothetical protein